MKKNDTQRKVAKSKRKPGRPPKSERPITPEAVGRIAELWLQGQPIRRIAAEFDVDDKTIHYHLERIIKPLWKESQVIKLEVELAKIAYVERIAWERFHHSTKPQIRRQIKKALLEGNADLPVVERVIAKVSNAGDTAWIDIVRWSIEQRAKIGGLYAAQKHEVSRGDVIRVAGQTPSEFNAATLRMILSKIEERRRYEAAVATRYPAGT